MWLLIVHGFCRLGMIVHDIVSNKMTFPHKNEMVCPPNLTHFLSEPIREQGANEVTFSRSFSKAGRMEKVVQTGAGTICDMMADWDKNKGKQCTRYDVN